MMISSFRKSLCREEAGQAIILGAVSLLVLAVGIMTTAQLGWVIKEKIQLQHAADNAAYTSAALVARSLNFISWTNRAMVAQYVSAMAFQSYISFFDGALLMLAQIVASLLTAAFFVGIVAKIPFLAFLEPVSRALGEAGKAIKEVVDAGASLIDGVDVAFAAIVSFISGINHYFNYWLMQRLGGRFFVETSLFAGGVGSGEDFYSRVLSDTAAWRNNDVGVNQGDVAGLGIDLYSGIGGIMNMNQYSALFDEDSESIKIGEEYEPASGPGRAKALMTEIVNASRDGNSGPKWETRREFGVGALISPNNEDVKKFLNRIFPSSEGGAILSRVVDKETLYAESDSDAGKSGRVKDNPLFNNGKHYGNSLPSGDSLISIEYIGGIDAGLPSPIDVILDWISVAGELLPMTKVVGIQATYNDDFSYHCKYSHVGSVDVGDALDGMCDDVCDGLKDKCEDKCHKECPQALNENGECPVQEVWKGNEGNTTEENEFCEESCAGATSSDSSERREACNDVKDKCQEGIEAAAESIQDGADSVISGVLGGTPAKVFIKCDKENGRHSFSGITPYVSFNIQRYREKQESHGEPYPSFFAAAHKKPSFLPENSSALGFGDRYKESNKFKYSSVGVVEGVTSKDVGECSSTSNGGEGLVCLDEYNFNYMGNGEIDFPLGDGIHAWARAQVYYHRSGTWSEPPNLFNPYWKAKLSPIAPLLTNSMGNLGDDAGESLGALGELFQGALSVLSDALETLLSH